MQLPSLRRKRVQRLLTTATRDRILVIGDVGFHHYAFQLRSRKDVDALQVFLHELGAIIVDPAAEYYDDYYAVFFLDPDGLKLEAMYFLEKVKRGGRPPAGL